MRKEIIWLMSAAVLLTGCSQKKPSVLTGEEVAQLFANDHTAAVELVLGELEMTADLTRTDGMTAVVITSPEHLAGLQFTPDSISFGELSAGNIPAASVGAALDEAMDALARGGLQPDENGSIKGAGGNGSFVLKTENGQPALLELPALDLKIQYKEYYPAESDDM